MVEKPSYEELEQRVRALEQEVVAGKQAEEALRESEARLRRFYESDIAGFARTRVSDGKLYAANEYMVRLLGYEDRETCLKDYIASEHYVDPQNRQQMVEQLQKTGRATNLELPVTRGDGSMIWVSFSAVLYPEEDYIELVVIDITKRKLAEEALKGSEENFRALAENANDGILIAIGKGVHVYANKAASKITGYSIPELLKIGFKELSHPDELEKISGRYNRRIKDKPVSTNYETTIIRKDGERTPVEITAGKTVWQTQPAVICIFRDITERKQKDQELKEKEAELKVKARSLEDVNTALRVLLKRREEDKGELEEKVLSNVKNLVLPYVERLRKTRLDNDQMSCLGILESNLNDIVSPFARTLTSKYLNLTPTEIRVAGLVKDGKTSKEIAELMNVSGKTIEFHRDNIRNKLGMKHKKANLRTYLLSM